MVLGVQNDELLIVALVNVEEILNELMKQNILMITPQIWTKVTFKEI